MIHDHLTWIEISKSALKHNLAQYKSVIGPGVLAPVIKANAYGHGLIEIAHLCQENAHVGWFCTAMLSEALTLRTHGITKPVLVHSCIDVSPEYAINKNIDFIIHDFDMAEHLNAVGTKHTYVFSVHIKVDTGLSRLGIAPKQVVNFIEKLQQLPGLKVTGICTHFAESQKQNQQFTYQQLERFNTVLDALKHHGISIPYKHVANSAATTALNLPACNLFRVGIGAYGLWPSPENKIMTQKKYPNFTLKPILTWKTRIIHIKKVSAHQYVGYDRTCKTTHETIIATTPIGYYDGYDFRLFNQAKMRVNNQYARVVGRVSMNLTTLDVTGISDVHVGDEVIILGDYPGISAYELGILAGNPNIREITTKINPVIPRIIVP